jgi:hypothetical protein
MAASGFGSAELFGGIASSIFGGLQSYYSAKAAKKAAAFEAEVHQSNARMALINARINERMAQGILQASEINQSQVSMKAAKVKAGQRASMGARGVVIGEGNTAEELATTDMMKEMDMLQINADSVRKAGSARMSAVNAIGDSVNSENQALFASARASSINPGRAGLTSLLDSGTQVAASWYRRNAIPKERDWLNMMPSSGSAVTPLGSGSMRSGRGDFFNSAEGRYM